MPHHIVLLEDNQIDAELIKRELRSNGVTAAVNVAPTRTHLESLLSNTKVDLVLSDSAVGDFTALDAVKLTKAMQPSSGFIIVSSHMDEKRAEQARRLGAIEWVHKDFLSQLPPLVHIALDAIDARKRDADATQTLNEKFAPGSQQVLLLMQAMMDLSKAHDLETVQTIVRTAARKINNADGATFVLRDGNQCYYADEDAIAPLWKGQRFPMSACISGWAMIHRKAAVIPDITVDERIPQDAYRPTFVKSLVMTPIRVDAPIGAIGTYWAIKHEASPQEIELMQVLANSASIALENISLYKQLERRVAERTQQLEDTNESLREFSYFVSHDLRAPIRQISAFADILKEELPSPSMAFTNALNAITGSASRMSAMLEGLLKLAQLGTDAIDPVDVNMIDLANDAAESVLGTNSSNVTVVVQNMPECVGSQVLLRQVWTNLLNNAIKFSGKRPSPQVVVGCEHRENQVFYFVRDNGVGFDSAKANDLFTAFHRLHSTKEYPGTGVGLAIVHRIITRHGGCIWAESQPDKGATFFFTINLTQ